MSILFGSSTGQSINRFDAAPVHRSTDGMGLLDRNKRKPSPVVQPSSGAAASPAAPVSSPMPSPDSDSLRDMLIAAVSARDNKLVHTLVNANREAIATYFPDWQKVPEPIRNNGGAMQRYATTLINLAEIFRDHFGDVRLAQMLAGPDAGGGTNTIQAQWEQGLAQADALVKEDNFDAARDLLTQIVNALRDVPGDGPVPFHAVTHGRLAHVLFSKGEVEPAAEHMRQALQLSEARAEEQGIAAGLRGMYEICRYQGKFAEAADYGDRLSAELAKLGKTDDAQFWTRQSARVRAGEPLCRVVFFVNDQQWEVEDVPRINEGRLRYGFVRNRPPLTLCEILVQRGMAAGSQAKFDEAMGHFAQAAKVDPHDPSAHYQSAVTLMHLQRPADAVVEYDITERLAPGWFNCRSERWMAAEIAAGRVEPPTFFILRTEEMPDASATWDQKLSLVDQAICAWGNCRRCCYIAVGA